MGAGRVRVPRDHRPIICRHLLRQLLPQRDRSGAACGGGSGGIVPPRGGERGSLPAHGRSRGRGSARRGGLPRRIRPRCVPPRVAAQGTRRDQSHAGERSGHRGVRAPPRCAAGPACHVSAFRLVVLPGDGIGPEVVRAALSVLAAVAARFRLDLALTEYPMGAAGVAAHGDPFPPPTRAAACQADAVLLGAVGDPSLDGAPRHLKPETGLLALRAALGVYANLRPVAIHPALADCSPLRPERLAGTDL
ncbi:MAG: hypothetical protein E4H38_04435, partial [Gemmatimonadales bacterium]